MEARLVTWGYGVCVVGAALASGWFSTKRRLAGRWTDEANAIDTIMAMPRNSMTIRRTVAAVERAPSIWP